MHLYNFHQIIGCLAERGESIEHIVRKATEVTKKVGKFDKTRNNLFELTCFLFCFKVYCVINSSLQCQL